MDGTWGLRSGKSFCAEGDGKTSGGKGGTVRKNTGCRIHQRYQSISERAAAAPWAARHGGRPKTSLPAGATLGIGGTTFNVVADTSKSPKTLDITEPRQGARSLMIAFDDRADRSAVRLGTGRRCQLHDDLHEVGKNSLYPREQTVSFEHEHNKYSVRNQIAAVECFAGRPQPSTSRRGDRVAPSGVVRLGNADGITWMAGKASTKGDYVLDLAAPSARTLPKVGHRRSAARQNTALASMASADDRHCARVRRRRPRRTLTGMSLVAARGIDEAAEPCGYPAGRRQGCD